MSRGYAAIGLLQPKTNANVGGVLRACGCYGARLVVVEGQRYQRHGTDPQQQVRHMPLLHGRLRDMIPYDCVPVAVDLCDNAHSLHTYVHPERAFYIFGPEDGTLGKETLSWCRDVIYVPTRFCMNLAATVNVILYDRTAKRERIDGRLRGAA